MSSLDFAFNVEEPSHFGSSFILTAIESNREKENGVFNIPIRSVPSSLHRGIYRKRPYSLIAIIPSPAGECDELIVTCFNIDSQQAKLLIEAEVNSLKSSVDFLVKETSFSYDPYIARSAYEGLIIRTLEEIGWWIVYEDTITLFKGSLGYAISSFKINFPNSLQFASNMIKMGKGAESNREKSIESCSSEKKSKKIIIRLNGQNIDWKFNSFYNSLEKSQKKQFETNGNVDLNGVNCRVFPRLSRALAIRLVRPNDTEERALREYWRDAHGVNLQKIAVIVHISFRSGGDELSYPAECVIEDQVSHFEEPLMKKRKEIEEKNILNSIQNEIKNSLSVAAVQQKAIITQ